MSKPPRLEDFLVTDGLPLPWNHLQHSLEIGIDYADGAKKIVGFLVNVEESIPLDELFETLLNADPPAEWFEFLIVCMLDTGFSDIQAAKNVLRLHCLRRLFMKMEGGIPVEQKEEEIYRNVHSLVRVDTVSDFFGLTYVARSLLESLIDKIPLDATRRQLLTGLIRFEAQALRVRINRLSDSIDAYSIKEMGRMLPIVKRFDENLREAEYLAVQIEKDVAFARATMTFAKELRKASFEKWLEKMGNAEGVVPLKEALSLQYRKCAPTRSVVALMSLYRWVFEAHGITVSPIIWAQRALEMYDEGRFRIGLGTVIDRLRDHLLEAGAWIEGETVSGSFTDRLYSQWIGTSGLSRPLDRKNESEEREKNLTIRQMVYRFFNNSSVMLRLLDNSEIIGTPGIVEFIAKNSRSAAVLSKIASNNNLYAGPNNAGVPAALLTNPARIPLTLLRIFFKPSFFSRMELKRLLVSSSQMRPEVVSELQEFLAIERE
jgi:hypothetical protein